MKPPYLPPMGTGPAACPELVERQFRGACSTNPLHLKS